jgi:hypothetical protein
MKKTGILFILLIAVILARPAPVPAAGQYRQIDTPSGEVIVGLDREEAYRQFGAPASKGEGLWYYTDPAKFFVNFSEAPTVLLYPDFCRAVVGMPTEFKVFLNTPDLGIRDITQEAELIFDQAGLASLVGTGVFIPKKAGEFSALAIYKDILSNPINILADESKESGPKEKEVLLSVDVLP